MTWRWRNMPVHKGTTVCSLNEEINISYKNKSLKKKNGSNSKPGSLGDDPVSWAGNPLDLLYFCIPHSTQERCKGMSRQTAQQVKALLVFEPGDLSHTWWKRANSYELLSDLLRAALWAFTSCSLTSVSVLWYIHRRTRAKELSGFFFLKNLTTTKKIVSIKILIHGAKEITQWLKLCTALAGDPSSLPITNTAAFNSGFRVSIALFWPLVASTSGLWEYQHLRNTTHKLKINLCLKGLMHRSNTSLTEEY